MRPRLDALDVLRGMTMLAMVLVNNPGDWGAVYPPLLHAEWHGCTPTDLIFPFFLFAVGAAMAFSLHTPAPAPNLQAPSMPDAGGPGAWPFRSANGTIYRKIARRTCILLLLGLGLNAFLTPDLSSLRIPGVLQRIALCYALTALLLLHARTMVVVAISAAVLVGYWILLRFVPPPSMTPALIPHPSMPFDPRLLVELRGEGGLSNLSNWPRWVDLQVLGHQHTWIGSPTDPEGLLSTLPACVSVVIGALAGVYLRVHHASLSAAHVIRLALWGIGLLAGGLLWSLDLPLNKPLWTSSYVLVTGGWALLALAAWVWVVDVAGWRWLGNPFRIAGLNAITLFVGSGILARLLTFHTVTIAGTDGAPRSVTLKAWIVEQVAVPLAARVTYDPRTASLVYALLMVAAWWLALWIMHRRGWVLRVG
jgi:predicted acyltransferase